MIGERIVTDDGAGLQVREDDFNRGDLIPFRRSAGSRDTVEKQSLRDTIAVLAGVLEAYSPSLGLHSKRVSQMARALAEQMRLPDNWPETSSSRPICTTSGESPISPRMR